ncbi:MAG: hypothetical protein Q4E53_05710 [Eubacteriales bacterium]|nr:hypothetical protein [Eubacteriales bacterium]
MAFDLNILKRITTEYPPDLSQVSRYIRENLEVVSLAWQEREKILSSIIKHAYRMNVCDVCELVDDNMSDLEFDDTCEACDHEGKMKLLNTDGRYSPDMIALVLNELGITGEGMIYSDECWVAVLYATFDRYTEDVARVLLENNIVPANLSEIVERFDVRADYVSTIYDDEELYQAYMKVIEMLQKGVIV